jgi:F-type H+-transporting ATPase subunit delta
MLIGKEDGEAEHYREELAGLTELIAREPMLEQAISNPLYETEARRRVLETILDKLKLSKIMTSFMLLLFDKGRIGFINHINDFYQKLADELKGMARASLVSATELSSEAVDKIRESLANMTGKEVVLDLQQDANLIGGIVTKIGDLVLDGSVRTQLAMMKESIKRGESV